MVATRLVLFSYMSDDKSQTDRKLPHSGHSAVTSRAVWLAVLHMVHSVPCAWCHALSRRARLGSGKTIVALGVKCNSVSFWIESFQSPKGV